MLEDSQVVLSERVGLGDNGDQVDARPKALHDLNVEGLKTEPVKFIKYTKRHLAKQHSRVTGRPDEVQARMHPQVALLAPLRLLLLDHVRLMLVVNEVDNGSPRVAVVDVVAKAGCVDNGELHFELLLLELSLDDLDLSKLVELLVVTARVVLRGRKLGREKSVDEGGFSKTRLAYIKIC